MYSIANLQSTQYSVLFYFIHSFMKTISLQHMLLKHIKPVDVVIIFFIYFWQTAIGVDSKLLFAFQHWLTALCYLLLFKNFYQCTIKKIQIQYNIVLLLSWSRSLTWHFDFWRAFLSFKFMLCIILFWVQYFLVLQEL